MDYRELLIHATHQMVAKGLTSGTGGNISSKDPVTGLIYITPSGMEYPSLKPEDIVVFGKDHTQVQGERRPSMEYPMHLSIYRSRRDVQAILHTHPIYSTALGVARRGIPPITEEFVLTVGNGLECAMYARPGTADLARNAVAALGEKKAVLLPNHGALSVGSTMEEAFLVSEVVEKTALIYLLSISLGRAEVLSKGDIEILLKSSYGQGKRVPRES